MFRQCRRILEESIAVQEQLPSEEFARLLATDEYRVYAFQANGEAGGVAVIYLSVRTPFVLLDYMAIRYDRRGRGLGATLFAAVVDIARAERPEALWLVFEVDDDREGSRERRSLNRRRIAFYRRCGAHLLENVPYRFPASSTGPVAMRLMAYPLRFGATITAAYLQEVITDTFRTIHPGNDDLMRWIVERVPPDPSLE